MKGLKLSLSGDMGAKGFSAKTGIEYVMCDYAAATASVDLNGKANLSLSAGHEGFTSGISAGFSPSLGVHGVVAKASYDRNNFQVASEFSNGFDSVKVGFSQKIDSSVTLAAQFKTSVSKLSPIIVAGAQYSLSKGEVVRVKADSAGVLAGTYVAKLSDTTTLKVGFVLFCLLS